jgi:hypothetical protein
MKIIKFFYRDVNGITKNRCKVAVIDDKSNSQDKRNLTKKLGRILL